MSKKQTSIQTSVLSPSRPGVKLKGCYNFFVQNQGTNPTTISIGKNGIIQLSAGQSYTFEGHPDAPIMDGYEISAQFDLGATQVKFVGYYAK